MRNKLIPVVLVFAISIGFSGGASALPTVSEVIKTVKTYKTAACEKGSIFKMKFTIRSFDGRLCEYPVIAYIANFLCKDAEGYADSKCAKKGKAALGEITPGEKKKAEEVLDEVKADTED